jgi:hypothetical protein
VCISVHTFQYALVETELSYIRSGPKPQSMTCGIACLWGVLALETHLCGVCENEAWGLRCISVVESLPSLCEALGFIPSTITKREARMNERWEICPKVPSSKIPPKNFKACLQKLTV